MAWHAEVRSGQVRSDQVQVQAQALLWLCPWGGLQGCACACACACAGSGSGAEILPVQGMCSFLLIIQAGLCLCLFSYYLSC